MGRKRRSKPQHLASKLLAIRRQFGVSQAQMTKLLESTELYGRISEYERGKREPNLFVLLKYARLAKVPVETLIDDTLGLPL